MNKISYRGEELLPPKADIVFKALFTKENNRDMLASFIGSVLNIPIAAEDVALSNVELPPPHEGDKLSRLDVRVTLADQTHLDIEIQLRDEGSFAERSVFYLAKLYTGQMKEGMTYDELCRSVAINLMDFNMFTFDHLDKFHSRFRLMEMDENRMELTDVIELDFIELPKVPEKNFKDMKTMWAIFLSTGSQEVLDMLATKSPVMEKALTELRYISADEQARYEFDMRQKATYDYYNAMIGSLRKGEAIGEARGEARGRAIQTEQIAVKMLKSGKSLAEIKEFTELSDEALRELELKISQGML